MTMGKGTNLEGKSMVTVGLMVQDTGGKIDYRRHHTTYEADEGVDHIIVLRDKQFDYFKYLRKIKEEGSMDEQGKEDNSTR